MNIEISTLGNIGSLISGVATAFGAWFAYFALKENTKTRELQLLDNAFKEIKAAERDLYLHFNNKEKKEQWDSLFFNSIEYFSLLVNSRYISDPRIIKFFADAIIMWYEDIFLENTSKKDQNDPKIYPQMKKLYHRLKFQQLRRN